MAAPRVLASVAVLLTAAVSCSTSTASPSNSSTLQHQATLPRVNYGGIIMAGGSSGVFLTTVEVINTKQLPPLPAALADNTLTAVGSVLFNCGGYDGGGARDACYTLDVEAFEPQWQHTLYLPIPMYFHTATAVGSHIWFIYNQTLYDLDTETGLFHTLSTPFYVTTYHCAVVSYGYTFIIGAGSNRKEVWVNTKESEPSEWKHLMDLSEPKELCACLLFEDKIYITGNSNSPYQQVTIIDLYTNEVDTSSSLQTGRYGHASFVLDGKPAVAGGYNNENADYLDSIETYDEASHTWSTDAEELTEAKFYFGTVQLLD